MDLAVDVAQLLKDYKDNELHGDATYKGKRILLVGKAGEIKRDMTGAIYLTVGTGDDLEIPEAQCFFGDEYASRLASMTHGQSVAVNGTVDGLMMNVLLKGCSLASTMALDVCYKLRDAGIVAQCVLQWMKNDSVVPFLTSNIPAGLPAPKRDDFVQRVTGVITYAEDDDLYARLVAINAKQEHDAGTGSSYVRSPSARISVLLPRGASADLRARATALVDRLPPASK